MTVHSVLATGSGGVAIAWGIYKGAVALERLARPAAKREIGRFLVRAQLPTGILVITHNISELFQIVSTKRHISTKCVWRSALATAAYFVVVSLLFYLKNRTFLHQPVISIVGPTTISVNSAALHTQDIMRVYPVAFFVFIFADYISLAKGRFIIIKIGRINKFKIVIGYAILDLLLSVIISLICVWIFLLIAYIIFRDTVFMTGSNPNAVSEFFEDAWIFLQEIITVGVLPAAMFTSTFTTSIWAAGISVSALLLKIASPLNYVLSFVRWLLPIESRPIIAIGAVAAIIVWLGSVLYGLL